MHRLALRRPRYGYRRITVLLRRKGWRVNVKRVHRLWKAEGLQIRKKSRKRRRLGNGDNACHRHRPEYKDHVWSYDFVSDRTEKGGRLRMLTVVDEFTRECLTIEVARKFKGRNVVEVLKDLFADSRPAEVYSQRQRAGVRLKSGEELAEETEGRNVVCRTGPAPGRTVISNRSTASCVMSALTASCFCAWRRRDILLIAGGWIIMAIGRTVCWIG